MIINPHIIYIAITSIYDNQTLPIIPKLLISYLLANIDKTKYYLNQNINIDKILEYLSNQNIINSKDILNHIIKYIEQEAKCYKI